MKSRKFRYTAALVACGMIAACSPDSKLEKPEDFKEAPKCDASVTVIVADTPESKASSVNLEENIDRFTATRVDTKTNLTLVAYHGRNGENIGMVQLIDPRDNQVKSELVLPDTRVNYAQLNVSSKGSVAYVGVDRNGGREPFCGILCVPVKDSRFYVGESGSAQLVPYKVDGVSINCIKNQFGDTDKIGKNIFVVAAGGNAALGEGGEAGFTKFEIDPDDPCKLGLLAKETAPNFRGYWFSFGYLNGAPLSYTWRTVDNGQLVYHLGVLPYSKGCDMFSNTVNSKFIADYRSTGAEVEILRDPATAESFARFSTIAIKYNPGYKFVIASTGKVVTNEDGETQGGVMIYRFAEKDAVTGVPSLTLVDRWPKAAVCLSTEVIAGGEYYIFAGCGDGIYKLHIEFDTTDKDAATARIVPEKKYTDIGVTEAGTPCSINYMQVKGSGSNAQIHVAGGYKGYYVLKMDDFTVPCDPRR